MPVARADHQIGIQKQIPPLGICPLLLNISCYELGVYLKCLIFYKAMPPFLLSSASGEAIEQTGSGAQLPTCPKMGSPIRGAA